MTYSCGILESLDEDLKLDLPVIPVQSNQHQFNNCNVLGTFVKKFFIALRAVAPKYPQSSSRSDMPGTASSDCFCIRAITPTDIELAAPTSSILTSPGDVHSLTLSNPLYHSQIRNPRHIIQKTNIETRNFLLGHLEGTMRMHSSFNFSSTYRRHVEAVFGRSLYTPTSGAGGGLLRNPEGAEGEASARERSSLMFFAGALGGLALVRGRLLWRLHRLHHLRRRWVSASMGLLVG